MSTEAQTGPQIDNWRDFQTSLRAYVGRRVEAGAVEDVVGDILLLLVRYRDRLAVADEPAAWVFRVAANAIADHHRRRAAEARALTQYAAGNRAERWCVRRCEQRRGNRRVSDACYPQPAGTLCGGTAAHRHRGSQPNRSGGSPRPLHFRYEIPRAARSFQAKASDTALLFRCARLPR